MDWFEGKSKPETDFPTKYGGIPVLFSLNQSMDMSISMVYQ